MKKTAIAPVKVTEQPLISTDKKHSLKDGVWKPYTKVTPANAPGPHIPLQKAVALIGLVFEMNVPGMKVSRAISGKEAAKDILGYARSQKVTTSQLYDELLPVVEENLRQLRIERMQRNPQAN